MPRLIIDRVGIQLTTDCNFRCRHCLSSCEPTTGLTLDFHNVQGCIDKAAAFGVKTLAFTGGEPFQHPSLTINSLSHAKSSGLATQLVTNGGWARDSVRRQSTLDNLAGLDLNLLALSFDIFHRPFIADDIMATLIFEALARDIKTNLIITLSRHPHNVKVLKLAASLNLEILISNVCFLGRAKLLDPREFLRSGNGYGKCMQSRAPLILADGQVVFCCGFADLVGSATQVPLRGVMGNIFQQDLKEMLAKKDLAIRRVFSEHKIGSLFKFSGLPERGVDPRSFASACDMCFSMLSDQKAVHRLERLGQREVSMPSDTAPRRKPLTRIAAKVKGKRMRLRPGAGLIKQLQIVDWAGILDGDTEARSSPRNILCVPDHQGFFDYHIVGDTAAKIVERLLEGDEVVIADPAEVLGSDPTHRVAECLERWMILNLHLTGAMEEMY